MSATDPDAAIVKRGDSRLRYQRHRAVDVSGVITATAVADSKYGTAENYLACRDAGMRAHIPTMSGGTAKRDLKLRQHLCEASFGNAVRYGFKRARWRRMWRVTIQDLIICTVQNIEKLMQYLRRCESGAAAIAVRRPLGPIGGLSRLYALLWSFFATITAKLYCASTSDRLLPALTEEADCLEIGFGQQVRGYRPLLHSPGSITRQRVRVSAD